MLCSMRRLHATDINTVLSMHMPFALPERVPMAIMLLAVKRT